MIPITDEQYIAIGKVTVESGTLDWEIKAYIRNLGKTPKRFIGDNLERLDKVLQPFSPEFVRALALIRTLLDQRVTVTHGIWSSVSKSLVTMGDIEVSHQLGTPPRKVTLHAKDIERVARKIREARKLLLALCCDYCRQAAGTKVRPKATIDRLFARATP